MRNLGDAGHTSGVLRASIPSRMPLNSESSSITLEKTTAESSFHLLIDSSQATSSPTVGVSKLFNIRRIICCWLPLNTTFKHFFSGAPFGEYLSASTYIPRMAVCSQQKRSSSTEHSFQLPYHIPNPVARVDLVGFQLARYNRGKQSDTPIGSCSS